MNRAPLTTDGWFGKAAAGVVLGLAIAILASALFAWFGPGGIMDGAGKTQFNMWLISPVWALVLSLVFLFHRARDAWLGLGVATLVLAALLAGGRLLLQGFAA